MTAPHRPRTSTVRLRVSRRSANEELAGRDPVVVEEPLEIRVGPLEAVEADLEGLAVTMRTPGHDFELATGFVVTEGIVADPTMIRGVAYCGLPPEEQEYNVVTVRIAGPVDLDRHRRNVYTTSSCGVCGKGSIDAVEVAVAHVPVSGAFDDRLVGVLPDRLRARQRWFDETGGLHAAGLFDLSGEALIVREDVGRHNAVDKVVGWAAHDGQLPLTDRLLVVSGRAGFEIVQKAAVAGIASVVAVSAPSSLAVAAAQRFGMTLIGFARGATYNVYAGSDRVGSQAPGVTTPDS